MLRTYDGRRLGGWLEAIDGPDAFPAACRGSVLTVSTGRGETVARRRFRRHRDAEKARRRFVGLVSELSDDDHATADRQAVPDRA